MELLTNVSKKDIEKIRNDLIQIQILCDNIDIGDKLENIINNINTNILKDLHEDKKENLLNVIYEKMIETKNKNPDLNTILYITYQDLKNNRIGYLKAHEQFKKCMRMDFVDGKFI